MGSWKITYEVERFIETENYEEAITEVFKDQKGIYHIVDVKEL